MNHRIKQLAAGRLGWFKLVAAVAVVAVVVGGYSAAQHLYYQTPNKLWHDALGNSLQNRSVTVTLIQKTDDTDRRQTITYSAGGQNQARSDVVLRSQGSLVVTETIGTTTADYSRYTQIKANNKDYKNVIGVWAKTDLSGPDQTASPLLTGIALRTSSIPGIPLVNVPASQQVALYKLLNEAVTTDFKTVTETSINDRPVMVYKASIKPKAYITYIKALDEALGYKKLSSVATDSYEGRQDVVVDLAIAKDDHRLARLSIPEVQDYQELYGSYGKAFTITIPDKTITNEALQDRLQNN